MTTAALIFLCVFSMGLLWYIKELLKRYLLFQEEVDEFVTKVQEYEEHLRVVYQLESFNGDQTLANLLRHSKAFAEECESFRTYLSPNEESQEEMEGYEEEI